MEHIKKHKEAFEKVIKKYNLSDEDRAEEIATFLTKHHEKQISAKSFADLFAMDEEDAVIFLSWIKTGIEFKEQNIDKNKK